MTATANIIDAMSTSFGRDFGAGASSYLGEPTGATTGAINTVIPALLGTLANKASTTTGAMDLLTILDAPTIDTRMLGNVSGLFASGDRASALVSQGAPLASRLLGGEHVDDLATAVSEKTGVKPTSARSLLAMLVPLVLAYFKRYVTENSLESGGLARVLGSQRDFVERAGLDSRIVRALGFGSLSSMFAGIGSGATAAASRVGQGAVQGARYVADAGSGAARSTSNLWWPVLLGVLALVVLWSMMRGSDDETVMTAPEREAVAPPPASIVGLPATVYFDADSAALGQGSADVLARAAMAVKTDGARLKITGYADRTGDPAANQELAKKRAQAVADALIAAGVPAENLSLEPPMFVTGTGNDDEARRVEVSRAYPAQAR